MARAVAYIECLDNLPRAGVDHRDRSGILRSDVNEFSIRTRRHAFRFIADLHRLQDFPLRNIDDACATNVFVGCVQKRPVFTEIELLRIRACIDDPYDLILRNIENTDSIRGLVGRRKLAFINAWSGDR